jgi:hypothetical protein
MLKRAFVALLMSMFLASCNGWIIQPLPYNPPTPFLPPSPTPSIYTQTPVIIGVASATPDVLTSTAPTETPTAASVDLPTETPTSTATLEVTPTNDPNGVPSISIQVLGCNTSIDVTHGMGEVTNAFVIVTNTGPMELTDLRVTLYALDEGRAHPDKTVELTSLPIGYQVPVKLTVDTTYKQDSPIQVEVVSDQGTFPREGLASCTDLGLFAPGPEKLNTPVAVSQ